MTKMPQQKKSYVKTVVAMFVLVLGVMAVKYAPLASADEQSFIRAIDAVGHYSTIYPDETVQIGESEQLARAAGSNATMLRIAGATHTFNVAHGMASPSPQLLEATDRTVRFFVDRLLAPARG